jgi:restriction endonuclease S subunit
MKTNFVLESIGKYVTHVSKKNKNSLDIKVYSVTNSKGFVESTEYFNKEVFSKNTSTYKIVKADEFAYNPSRINVGSIDYLRNVEEVLVSPLYVCFSTSPNLSNEYLLKFLKSPWGNVQIRSKAQGAVRDNLKFNILEKLQLPIPYKDNKPDYEAQLKIANILNSVDEVIQERKVNIKLLNDFIRSTFITMFGNPVTNLKAWKKKKCSLVIPKITSGTSYGGEEVTTLSEDEYGVLKISAVTKGFFDPSERKAVNKKTILKKLIFVKKGDLIFSRANTRDLVAACAIVDKDYDDLFLPDKLWKLELNNELVRTQFVDHLLKNESFRNTVKKLASGGHTSMLNISMKKFQSLDFIVPDMDVQDKFCAVVEKVESLKLKYKQNLAELENLYGSLSQKAFKGELDLTKLSLPDVEGEKPVDDSVIALQPVKAESGSLIEIEARQAIKDEQTPHVTADFSFDELPKTREEREALLSNLFNEQIDDKKGQVFDLEVFWQDSRVQHLLWNMPEEEQSEMEKLFEDYPPTELAIWQQQGKYKDYKKIREWIVMAIKGNRLIQQFDENSGRIQLKVVE